MLLNPFVYFQLNPFLESTAYEHCITGVILFRLIHLEREYTMNKTSEKTGIEHAVCTKSLQLAFSFLSIFIYSFIGGYNFEK